MSTKTYTATNISDADISSLRNAAGQAGDLVMVAICDRAEQDDDLNVDDYAALDSGEWRKVRSMSRDEAMAAVVDATNDAALNTRSPQ